MTRLFRYAAMALLLAAPANAQSTSRTGELQRLLDSAVARFPGKAGVWVKHLTTGEEAGARADDLFNSASVIKLPVLVLAMQMVDQGQLSLDDRITVTAADVRGGSGVLRLFDAGLQPTLRDLLTQMVVTSDNTATDIAIAKVGGVERVNSWLRTNGYDGSIRLNMTTGELFAKYAELPTGSTRDDKTNNDRRFWLGEMTPRATGRLIDAMQRCADGTDTGAPLASKARCGDMMRMMRAQLAGQRRLPHFLAVPIAHKTGDFPPVLANDVGVIFTRSGPVVVSFFANAITGPYAEAEDQEGRIAQRIVAYFERLP
jgi:beta-lactamase class A